MAQNSLLLQAKMLTASAGNITITQGVDGIVNLGLNLDNYTQATNISITATNKNIALVGNGLTFNSNKVYTAADANAASGVAVLSASSLLTASQVPVDGITLVQDGVTGKIKVATIRFKNTYSVTEVVNHVPTAINVAGVEVLLSDVELGDQLIIAVTSGGYAAGNIYTRKTVTNGKLTDDFVKYLFEQNMDAMVQGTVNYHIDATEYAAVTDLAASGVTGSKVITHDGITLLKSVNASSAFSGTGTAASALGLADGGIAISKLVNTASTSAPSNWVFSGAAITSGSVGISYLPVASTTKGIVSVAASTGLALSSGALSLDLKTIATNSYLSGDGKAVATGLSVLIGGGLTSGVEGDAGKIVVDTSVVATRTYVSEQVGSVAAAIVAPIDFTSASITSNILTINAAAIPKAIVKKTIDGETTTLTNFLPIFPDTVTVPDEDGVRTFTIDLAGLTIIGNWQVLF